MDISKEYIWNVRLAELMVTHEARSGEQVMINMATIRYALNGFMGMYKIDDALKENISAYKFNDLLFSDAVKLIDDGVTNGVSPALIIGMLDMAVHQYQMALSNSAAAEAKNTVPGFNGLVH